MVVVPNSDLAEETLSHLATEVRRPGLRHQTQPVIWA